MGAAIGFGGTAGQAANASLNWGAQGVGLSAAGQALSGFGQFQMGQYASAVAANNALIEQRNAAAARSAGTYEESASKLKTGELIGAQRAAQGANNVDVNVGSAVATRNTTAAIGAMDAAMIHYNAARAAYGMDTQAQTDVAQSKLDKMGAAGALTEGFANAGSTVLGGASSLAGRAAQFKLAFGNNSDYGSGS